MSIFKYVFALVWIALLARLVLAYGWEVGFLGYLGCTFFGAFVLVEREDEDE
jgi:hypothetical protein